MEKPIKAKLTEALFYSARMAPWIFPRWLSSTAESYSRESLGALNKFYERDDRIKTASLLCGDFHWKAIGVVVAIDHHDLDLIRRWLKSNAHPFNYNASRDDEIFKTRYEGGSLYRNLGWIKFDRKQGMDTLLAMEMATSFCKSCYATISMFSYGVNYLSLYFMLDDAATNKVCDVDVSNIARYYSLCSVNPFSKQFKAVQHSDKRGLIEKTLNHNINLVCSEVCAAAIAVLNLWGIDKSRQDLQLVGDFYRDTDQAYFSSSLDEGASNETHEYICKKNFDILDEKITSDTAVNFFTRTLVEGNELDAVFIKSKKQSSFEVFDNFLTQGLALYDSHLFIATFFDVAKRHSEIAGFADTALLKNKNKVEVNYDILFKAANKLDLLKENIAAIAHAIPRGCTREYAEKARAIADYRLSRANQLKDAIDRRLTVLNSEMQVENLRFNRRYSWLVGLLILVQIGLAALTIDWGKINSQNSASSAAQER